MSEVLNQPSTSAAGNAPASPAGDPFATLHKMSTTAGLGSGDYVAISATAIASILLGLSSALVLFDSSILLVLPIVGLICAVLAFRQISQSNGTQTGREVAALGFLLSLGFGGFAVGKSVYTALHNSDDEHQIIEMLHRFGQAVQTRDYHRAYGFFDERMQSKVPYANFEAVATHLTESPAFGNLLGMDWNGRLEFGVDPVTQHPNANGMVRMSYSKIANQPVRFAAEFQQINGKWQFNQLPQLFAEESATDNNKRGGSFGGPTNSKGTAGTTSPQYGPLGPPKPAP